MEAVKWFTQNDAALHMSGPGYHAFIDADRVIIDTDALKPALWGLLSRHTGLPMSEVASVAEDPKKSTHLGGYSLRGHCERLKNVDYDAVQEESVSLLRDPQYVMKGASTFLEKLVLLQGVEPVILSYGDLEWQPFKVGHIIDAMGFKDFPAVITCRPKNEFIRYAQTELNIQQGSLTDDIAMQSLPDGITEIHLDHSRKAGSIHGNSVVTDLGEAYNAIVADVGGRKS